MKRTIIGIMVTALLVVLSGTAQAEQETGEGTSVKAGIKTWVNEWNRDIPGTGRITSDNVVALMGPAVEVEFHHGWVMEASYLMSLSDYQFTEAGVTSEFDRSDLDLAIGKRINRFIGFFTGYRNSSFEEKGTGAKNYSYGLFYSLRGEAPFIGTSSLYGALTYLGTRFKAEGQAREDAPGWTVEIGGRTVFTERFTMKLGYKWETTKGEVSKMKDSFRGTMLDLTYAF